MTMRCITSIPHFLIFYDNLAVLFFVRRRFSYIGVSVTTFQSPIISFAEAGRLFKTKPCNFIL